MKIIYTPESGERQEFLFRPAELTSFDAEAIEEAGGSTWATFEEFGQKFMAGNLKARRAALWVMLRRSDPRLKFPALSVRVTEVDIDFEDDERANIRAAVEADADMDDDTREQALALLKVDEPGKGEPDDGPTDSPSPEPDLEPSPSS